MEKTYFFKIEFQRKDRINKDSKFTHEFSDETKAMEQVKFLKECNSIYENVEVFKCTITKEKL